MTKNIRDDERDIVRRNIVAFRDEIGLTQQSVAEMTGMSIDTYRALEAGRRVPGTGNLRRLAEVSGHALEDFFNPSPPPGDPSKRMAVAFKIVGEVDDDLRRQIETVVSKVNQEQARRVAELKRKGRAGKKL